MLSVRLRTVALTTATLLVAGLLSGVALAGAAPAVASPRISAPSDVVVGEGDGHVDLSVTLSAPGSNPVSVHYATANSTASGGTTCNNSYVGVAGTLNFAPGETTKTVPVSLLDCAAVQGFRSFTFGLDTATNSTITRATTRISIVDNDTVAATPQLFVRDATVDEKDGTISVPVLLGGPTGQVSNSTVTVAYATHDGTATAPGDYASTTGTLTFAPGDTVKNVSVTINDDVAAEPAERFTLALSNPTNATLAQKTGVVVIGASDASKVASPGIAPQADVVVGEGGGYLDLSVTLSAPGSSPVSVHYATANSTGSGGTTCNNSFVGVAGTLNFVSGETTKVVRIELLDCAAVQGFRSFTFGLDTATNATITRATTRISIVDNDTVAATPRLFVRDATVDEKDGTISVPVLLGGPTGQVSNSTVTVKYATHDDTGTATAPGDYASTTGTLTFAPGETVKNVAVAINDDVAAEPAERFTLALTNPTNATISDGTGLVHIGASDAAPVAVPGIAPEADVVAGEGDGYLDLTVTLSRPGSSPVSVHYTTANSTGSGGTTCNNSFVPVGGTLEFAPGETTKVVRVELLDCAAAQGFRSFTFGLDTATNATITRASTRISIVDNDTVAATPQLFVRDATVDEKDGTVNVSVLLGGPAGQVSNSTVTVKYATHDDTAVAPGDYGATTGTLTFAPGDTVKNVAVDIVDDAAAEPTERFTLTLTNPTNATLADGKGAVLIPANDAAPVARPGISAPANVVVSEGNGYVDLTVTLSAPGSSAVSVHYATLNGTGSGGTTCNNTFVSVSGTLNFVPGETAKVVRIELLNCAAVQGSRYFTFRLDTPTQATIARAKARVTVLDS